MPGLPWPGGWPAADIGGVVGPGQSPLTGSHAEHVLGLKRAPSLVPGGRRGPGRGTHSMRTQGRPLRCRLQQRRAEGRLSLLLATGLLEHSLL